MTKAIILVTFLLNSTTDSLSILEQSTNRPKDEKKHQLCWPGTAEEVNLDGANRKVPPLPARFDGAKVQRTFVEIKLCIDTHGQIDRSVVLTTSGNRDIDRFYTDTFAKWQFKPLVKAGVPVPSVLIISSSWNPR